MKKKFRDITFKEFADWCNDRAADGLWSLRMAALCCAIVTEIYGIRVFLRTKKAREEAWERIKKETFNLDAELEFDQYTLLCSRKE